MKKYLSVFLSILLIAVMSACGNSSSGNASSTIPSFETESYDNPPDAFSPSDTSLDADADTNADTDTGTDTDTNADADVDAIIGSDLFEQIYVPYAQHEMETAFADVKAFVENCGFESNIVESTYNSIGEIKVFDIDGDDYVYFAFLERSNGIESIMIVSFYHASSSTEVSLSNYSTDGNSSYDELKVHVIGESDESVQTVDEQRNILFATK